MLGGTLLLLRDPRHLKHALGGLTSLMYTQVETMQGNLTRGLLLGRIAYVQQPK